MTTIRFKGCDCAWRAKCEWSNGRCGELADMSEWMPDPANGRWRPVWLCGGHTELWRNRPEKLHGIDRPDHADEFWRPSIMEHVRFSMMLARMQDRSHQQTIGGMSASRRNHIEAIRKYGIR